MNLIESYLKNIQSERYIHEGKIHSFANLLRDAGERTKNEHIAGLAVAMAIIAAGKSLYNRIKLGTEHCKQPDRTERVKCIQKINEFAKKKLKDHLSVAKSKCNNTNQPDICKNKLKIEQNKILSKVVR